MLVIDVFSAICELKIRSKLDIYIRIRVVINAIK